MKNGDIEKEIVWYFNMNYIVYKYKNYKIIFVKNF